MPLSPDTEGRGRPSRGRGQGPGTGLLGRSWPPDTQTVCRLDVLGGVVPWRDPLLPQGLSSLQPSPPSPNKPGPGCSTSEGRKDSFQGAERPRRGFGDPQNPPPPNQPPQLGAFS